MTRRALKDLQALPRTVAVHFDERLSAIAADPFARQRNVTAVKGIRHGYRLRLGAWRALYVLDREQDEMIVTEIAHRREVYR